MERKTNNGLIKPTERVGDAADRPFCVFYVDLATPKAIHAETVMACSDDEARRLTGEIHAECMILYVRGVGTEDNTGAPDDPDRACNRHLPPLEGLPGARFIDGEFHAARNSDENELDAMSD